jgi:hypothetical protein
MGILWYPLGIKGIFMECNALRGGRRVFLGLLLALSSTLGALIPVKLPCPHILSNDKICQKKTLISIMYDKKNSQDTFLSQEKVVFMGSHEKKLLLYGYHNGS